MAVSGYQLAGTLNAWGGGTLTSVRSLAGEVLEVRLPNGGTAWTGTGGTTNFTLTRGIDGGTVLAYTNVIAPTRIRPLPGDEAVSGTVSLIVSQGQPSSAGTAYLYYRR